MGYKYIPQTYTVKEFDRINIDNNSVYILKKQNAAQQKGVLVFSTMNEYFNAKKELNIHKDNGIISKYITNPLTVDGKKMHLRVYVLVTIQSGITRCYIYDEYKIYTAESIYMQEDWLNAKIHISGPNSIPKQYIWPDDIDLFKDINGGSTPTPPEELLNNMNKCFKTLCQGISLSNLSHYKESYSGYHLYGADILLTDDNKVYILEVNKRPGFGWVKTFPDKKFSHNLFLFILNNTVFPFLGIKRLQNSIAEVCTSGNLLPFSNLLIGLNRNILIPIVNATKDEIKIASTKLQIDAYLIAQNNNIIGFLVLKNNCINIFIKELFQNHGIDNAMVELFIEIQKYRNYPHPYKQKSIKLKILK